VSLHSGYELTQFLDLVADDVPEFSLPSYLETFSNSSCSGMSPSDATEVTGETAPPPSGYVRELLFFYRQLCLLAQKMLEANHVSLWLSSPEHTDWVCTHVLGGSGQIGRVLLREDQEQLQRLLVEGLTAVSAAQQPALWQLLGGGESNGTLLVAQIAGSGPWQGIICCHRQEQGHQQLLRFAPVLRQLAQLGSRSLDSLAQNQDEQALLLRQQQLDRISYALSSKTGRAFFDELVRQLHEVLQASSAWLAELESPPLTQWARVVVCAGVPAVENFVRYQLQDTSCAQLYLHPELHSFSALQGQLPIAVPLADGYWGLPLRDSKHQVIGHLALTFGQGGFPEPLTLAALQQLIAHRASAELERLRAEAELRLSAVAFETNEGIIITDPDFMVLRVNHAFCHITGHSMNYVLGKRLGIQLWPWDIRGQFQFDNDGRWQGEVNRQHATGRLYPQWETWSPVRDEWGNISHYVICFEDMSERKAAALQIQNLAYYDDLTGLPNRRYLMEQVERSFLNARQNDMVGALLFIDLDHFKTINDSLGHATGDWLLQQASTRLNQLLRQNDLLVRLGGDEFVLLLPVLSGNPAQAEIQATMVAEQVIEQISLPYEFRGQSLHIGASVGISLFPTREQTPADLLKQADTAMYQAKSAGRRMTRLFDSEMQRQADRRLLIHNQLRYALKNNELLLHFQPQHMVGSGELIGAETLVRWQPAGRSMVSPAEFIPIAEETDLIIDIGQWVLLEACHQFVRWHEDGLYLPQLSVNVSAKQFHHAQFVDQVHEVLAETGMEPSALNLEITESVVLGNTEDTISKMSELKQLGISFSIDDFGTGYSSLGYLKRLPVDELKIDRSFIQDIPHDTSNMAIVEAVMAMASHLNFNVTAEGVETRQQLEFLKKQGCTFYQGFLASKPLPADVLARYIQRYKS
jgi:diguanylate cyclase (GGDEF)-like protein/PAS domain S-box-containing protein